jgi:hypothetical protein
MAAASATTTNGPMTMNGTKKQQQQQQISPTPPGGGNVRVVARIRPLSARESLEKEIMHCLDERLVQVKTSEQRFFELDRVFGVDSTQQQVYEASGAREAVTNDLFAGFNCTVSPLCVAWCVLFSLRWSISVIAPVSSNAQRLTLSLYVSVA